MKYYFLFSIILLISMRSYAQLNIDTIHIYFALDAYELDEKAQVQLQRFNREEKDSEILKIQAHCDTSGSVSYNQKLARRRLNSVKNELLIDLTGAEFDLYGETVAAKSNKYRAAEFRRVDIIYGYTIMVLAVPEIEEPVQEREIEKEFVAFLKDTTSSEATIQLSVNFVPGEDILLPGEEAELWRLYYFLRDNPTVKAHIRGHVCCSNDPDLSLRRAFTVYGFLIDRSVSGARLSYKGYSNTIPFTWPEVSEEDRISNRRVDIVFTK